MSKMGNVVYDVQERLLNSQDSYEEIAQACGVSVEWVEAIAQELEEYSPFQTSNS